jgi:hypothetical protein
MGNNRDKQQQPQQQNDAPGAAPETTAPTTTAPATANILTEEPIVNPFFALLESVTYSPSRTDNVNTQTNTGLKSKKLANATVLLAGGAAALHGSVYLRVPSVGKQYLDFTFFGTQFQSSITPTDAMSKAHLQEWRDAQAAKFYTMMKANPGAWTRGAASRATAVDASDLGITI